MKKLRKGQKVQTINQGSRANKKVYAFLLEMRKGESAIVNRSDWTTNVPLSHTIHNNQTLRGKFSCKQLLDNSGWLIKRL